MTQLALAVAAALAVQSVAPQSTAPTTPTVPDDGTPVAHLGSSTYVDLEGGAGCGSNPQLRVADSQAECFGRASATAVHARKTERTTTILTAYGENITYTGDGGSQQIASVTAHHDAQVKEHLSVFGDVSASLNTGGQLGNRFVAVPDAGTVTGPVIAPIPTSPDVTFLSINSRQYRFSGQLGLVAQVNARDTLTLSGNAEYGFSRGGYRSHYSDFSGLLGYDRQLNERWSLGGRIGLEQASYSGSVDSTIITPQFTARYQLSERWNAYGAVGVSIVDIKQDGVSDKSTGLSFDTGVCEQGESSNWCAHASRSQQRATTSGPVELLSFDLNYSRRLDAKQTIQLSGGVSRSNSTDTISAIATPATKLTYFRAAASYTREINRRLFGGVNVNARKYNQTGPDPKADVSGFIFLRYRLGDLQ